MSFWGDVVKDLTIFFAGPSEITGPAGVQAATSQAGGILALTGAAEGIFTTLTDYKMWRSVGWLLLGIALMLAGVALWIGPSAARQSPVGIAARELG